MKKISKVLLSVAPALTVAATLPIAMVSCNKQGDVFWQSKWPKTIELEKYTSAIYRTTDSTVALSIQEKFAFPKAEEDTHTIKIESQGLAFNNKVTVTEGQYPTLSLYDPQWTYSEEDQKCRGFIGSFEVGNCTLEKGAEITFDLKCTFGTKSGNVFTAVSSTSTIKGFKLTYNPQE